MPTNVGMERIKLIFINFLNRCKGIIFLYAAMQIFFASFGRIETNFMTDGKLKKRSSNFHFCYIYFPVKRENKCSFGHYFLYSMIRVTISRKPQRDRNEK